MLPWHLFLVDFADLLPTKVRAYRNLPGSAKVLINLHCSASTVCNRLNYSIRPVYTVTTCEYSGFACGKSPCVCNYRRPSRGLNSGSTGQDRHIGPLAYGRDNHVHINNEIRPLYLNRTPSSAAVEFAQGHSDTLHVSELALSTYHFHRHS